jgi:hydrogenase maturation protease
MRVARRKQTGFLLIGYGNTLRSDDGVGPCVAQQVEGLNLPGVRVLTCHSLTPELAEAISEAREVVFIDATVDHSAQIIVRALTPADSSQVMAHTADPRTLLALARDLFGHVPKAWWLTIPVENMEIGEEMSARAHHGMAQAVTEIKKMQGVRRGL